jgi:hypothetical protein
MKIHIQRRHASMLGEGSIRSQLQSSDSQVFLILGIRYKRPIMIILRIIIIIVTYIKKIHQVAKIITTMIHSSSRNKDKARSKKKILSQR